MFKLSNIVVLFFIMSIIMSFLSISNVIASDTYFEKDVQFLRLNEFKKSFIKAPLNSDFYNLKLNDNLTPFNSLTVIKKIKCDTIE